MPKHGVYVSKGDFVSCPTFNTHPEAVGFADRYRRMGYTCEVWGEEHGPDYNPDYVVATFNVREHTALDDHVVVVATYTVFDMGNGSFVVMHDTYDRHRCASTQGSLEACMSFAMMLCGWGPLGGWAEHDKRVATGNVVRGLPEGL